VAAWSASSAATATARRRPSHLDPQQRARLLAAKLQTLVEKAAGPKDRRSLAFPGGAALAGDDGTWVLADTDPARSLGPALAIARQAGTLDAVNVFVEGDAGLLARRASQFASPPRIWLTDGTQAAPEPIEPDPPIAPSVAAFADEIAAAGADPVVEHGRLIGEVEGLEVCRVEVGEDGVPRLAIGVGRFDREAHELLRGDTLHDVVALVRRHRVESVEPHPLRRWAAARALRSRVIREPGLVGADILLPMAPVVEAPDLRVSWPAPATGTRDGGDPLVVVCSVGVDLDLVPTAADARLADGRDADLVLAVPERDVHPVTMALAAALSRPAEIVAVA
jgi:hypothetical protein